MAARTINLIVSGGKLRRWFDDPTPTTIAELLGGGAVKDNILTLNVFAGEDDGGRFATADHSGASAINALIRRPGKGAQGGSIDLTLGSGTGDDYELPLSADQLQGILNGYSTVQSEAGTVEVTQAQPLQDYTIIGKNAANMTILAVDQINATPLCTAVVTTDQAGADPAREIQTLSIREKAMASQSTWTDIATPAINVTQTTVGSPSLHSIQTVEVTGYPETGEVIILGPVAAAVTWDINSTAAVVKAAINADTASLVSSVRVVGRHRWEITFTALSTQTAITGTWSGVEYHGLTAQLDLSTDSGNSVFTYEGAQQVTARFEFRIQQTDSGIDSIYSEDLTIDRGVIDSSSLTTIAGVAFSWLNLTDTDPTTYSGQAGKGVRVNSGETGLEFGVVRKNTSSATIPTLTEYATAGDAGIHEDTATGKVYHAYNDGGVLKAAELVWTPELIKNLTIGISCSYPNNFVSQFGDVATGNNALVGWSPAMWGTSINASASANKPQVSDQEIGIWTSTGSAKDPMPLSSSVALGSGDFTVYAVGYYGGITGSVPMLGHTADSSYIGFNFQFGALISNADQSKFISIAGDPTTGIYMIRADRISGVGSLRTTDKTAVAGVSLTGDFTFSELAGSTSA
ncbi:hypothetical protein N9937_02350, partial [bacterium]|nr:hypothetical protein [bacterium]